MIPNEYQELTKIFKNNTKNYVAAMPLDSKNKIDYSKYLLKNEKSNKIIVGNSGTETNKHIEVFQFLEHLKNDNIEIICPLSYGYDDYIKEVIRKGKDIFGDKFKPLTNFMEIEEYMDLLSSCSVGIFNNDRQQALGNIYALLSMGKKVYLREGTSMYKNFIDKKIKLYDVNDLKTINYDALFSFNIQDGINNNKIIDSMHKEVDNQWKNIFEN